MIKRIVKSLISELGILIPIKSKMDTKSARDYIQRVNPKPDGRCYTKNIIDLNYDLQIIIPAYNAEKYIKQCMESVAVQKSSYKILVTVVNDGSTDGTQDILEQISNRRELDIDIEIIRQANKGFSGARNAALKCIKGEYIMFLDSDDVLPENAIDELLNNAHMYNAEIVQGSWYSFSDTAKEKHIISAGGMLNDTKGYISGYPWGKIYKYSVLEHFQFPDGYWFEDTPISFILAAMPYKIVSIEAIVYGYRLNSDGITSKAIYSDKALDSYWITEQCLQEFPEFNIAYDQRAYEYLLRQSQMNYGRACKRSDKACEAEFILTAELIDRFFEGFHTEDNKMKKIESALKNKRYIQFKLFSLKE